MVLCTSAQQIEDLRRLAQLHELNSVVCALALPVSKDKQCPANAQSKHLPVWSAGRAGIQEFWVVPLVKDVLPSLPEQKIKSTKVVVPDAPPLVTFRVIMARDLVTKDAWETCKRNPVSEMQRVFSAQYVHSSYGWREITFATGSGSQEVVLQGYARCKHEHKSHILSHLGDDGIFVERLASDQEPRPPVWWVPTQEGEEPVNYLQRVVVDAKAKGATIAHRRGGGSYLGLRCVKGKAPAQLHAWTLSGAPKAWSEADVLQCLLDAECSEISIIRPPGRQRSWLLKAVVPEDNDLGVVAIQAGKHCLMLNRVKGRGQRASEVVSVIKAPRGPGKPSTSVGPKTAPKSSSPKPGTGKPEDNTAERGRSRSPAKDAPKIPVKPFQDKFVEVDCGGAGSCGYLCVAAALAMDKGEDFAKVKPELETRALTIRNDVYKHLAKHKDEYEQWYTPGLLGTEEQEDGPIPTNWSEWLEATLRKHRWIDGLCLKAMAKRYGVSIIVIPVSSDPKDLPMRFGEPRSGKPPVVMLFQSGHYTLCTLKPGQQWPREWLAAEEASLSNSCLRACRAGARPSEQKRAGEEEAQRTPWRKSRESTCTPWRPCSTPATSRRTGQNREDEWRPPETPPSNASASRRKSREHVQWRPDETPRSAASVSSKRSRQQAAWRPNETPKATASASSKRMRQQDAWRPDATPQAAASASSSKGVRDKKSSSEEGVKKATGPFVWPCNLCQEVFRGRMKKSVACARRRHIQAVHPKQAHLVEPAFKKRIKIVQPSDIPASQRAWSCNKCKKGLPLGMSFRALKASYRAHEVECYGLSKKQLKKRCYKRQSWKNKHGKTVDDTAAAKRASNDEIIRDYNAKGPGWIFRVPKKFCAGGSDLFGCARCTIICQKFKDIRKHACQGDKDRERIMQSQNRRAFWSRKRKQSQETAQFYVRNWKLRRSELEHLESAIHTGGRRGVTPAQNCEWIHDVVDDGDVEPNPGPHEASSCLQACMVNAGGAANTWAFARWMLLHKPAVAVVQEHCMLPAKQADLAQFLAARGYRSWFVAPHARQNVRGNWYTDGGVAVFVRKDKRAREIQHFVCDDGQALMVQLDHAVVVATYLPPRPNNDQVLTALDEWVCSLRRVEPVLVLGDFNHEPALANRWSALCGQGAVRTVADAHGCMLPTRKGGKRCIDWVWTSHPSMLKI